MHLIEQYSLATGVKIDKPLVSLEFYSIPFEKYIVVHAGSAAQPRRYDYFNEVLSSLRRQLYKKGVGIVQIGGSEEDLLDGAFDARGSRKKQMQFIIKNSELILCNDTCSAHFASGTQTPSIVLFGNSKPQNSKPYWSDEKICSILTPNYEEEECSYSVNEEVKRINEICPEEVANEVCKKLSLKKTPYKTKFIGENYNILSADLIPNFKLNTEKVTSDKFLYINIYLDECSKKELDFHNILFWCSNFKIQLSTKGKFDKEKFETVVAILGYCREPIIGLEHEIGNGFSFEDLSNIKSLNIPFKLNTKATGKELDNTRLEFFDEVIEECKKIPAEALSKNAVYIKSKKAFIADGRIYLTKWHRHGKIESHPNKNGYHKVDKINDSWEDVSGIIIKTKNKNGNKKENNS